jgi:hypothetical protein
MFPGFAVDNKATKEINKYDLYYREGTLRAGEAGWNI